MRHHEEGHVSRTRSMAATVCEIRHCEVLLFSSVDVGVNRRKIQVL